MWELLICHICKCLLENPKILTCSHSVCEECLNEVVKRKSKVFECPVCSNKIQVAIDNTFLSSVMDILQRETSACRGNSACDACFMDGLRNLRCLDCDLLLCTRCLHTHRDNVITRQNENPQAVVNNESGARLHVIEKELPYANGRVSTEREHEVAPIEKRTRNASDTFAGNHQVHKPIKCKRHCDKDLRFFCNNCAQLLCQQCVIPEHVTHIFVSASDAARISKAQLSTLLNQTTIRILYLSDALRDAKETEEKLTSRVKEIAKKISSKQVTMQTSENRQSTEFTNVQKLDSEKVAAGENPQDSDDEQFNRFAKAANVQQESILGVRTDCALPKMNPEVNPQTQTLLNCLNRKAKRKCEVLAGHRMKLEKRLALIHSCQRFTTNLIIRGSDEEVLILESYIMQSLGDLCQNTQEVPIECPDDDYIALAWRETHLTSEQSRELFDEGIHTSTKVITGEGCGSNCFATGVGLTTIIVGQDCTFTVTVKNQENKLCVEGRDSIIARIKTPHGGYFRAELIEHKLGKHKFRYRTYTAGPHILRITLRGEEILGSPFEMLSSGSTDYSQRGRLVTNFGKLGNKEGELRQPQGLAVDQLSRIFVADTGNHRIQVFDEGGCFLFAFGRKGTGPGEFDEPCDVTIARTGQVIVADRKNDRLQMFTPDGQFVRQMQGMQRPIAVTTDQYNNIVIVDSDHTRVFVATMAGQRLRSITRGASSEARLENVQDVACNQTGETFLISRICALTSGVSTATPQSHTSLVQVFDNNGGYIREFVTPPYTGTEWPNPCRLVTDYDDRVLATGSGNKVQVFTRAGGHLTNITFTEKDCDKIEISAIALTPNEAVVVADASNGRILVF